jgi:hypothetical protein
MWDDSVPSDLDIEDSSPEQLSYGRSLLVDLEEEFKSTAWLSGIAAIVIPIAASAALAFDWVDREPIVHLVIAAALAVGALAISLFSFVWLHWVRRRQKAVERRMRETRA